MQGQLFPRARGDSFCSAKGPSVSGITAASFAFVLASFPCSGLSERGRPAQSCPGLSKRLEGQHHSLPHACHVASHEILLGGKDQRISSLRSKGGGFAPPGRGPCVQRAISGQWRRKLPPDCRKQTWKEIRTASDTNKIHSKTPPPQA